MSETQTKPRVGLGVVIVNDEGKILIGKRKNSHAPYYSIPGGSLELGETFEAGAIRETKEETDLDILNPEVIAVTNNLETYRNDKVHFISIVLLVKNFTGELKNMEPEKCEEWLWVDPNNLPLPHFDASQMGVECYLKKYFIKNMKILKFPELRQTYCWDCGANAIQSILAYYGIDVREDIVIKITGTNKSGTPISGIKAVIKKYKLHAKAGKMTLDDIKNYLDKKIPVIILVQAWADKKKVDWKKDWKDGHYVVAIGYDAKKIYFEDPSSASRTYLTYAELQKRWHDTDVKGKKYINWGMAVFGKKADYDLYKSEHMD